MSLIRRAIAASAICLLVAPPSVRAQEVGALPVPVAELSAGYAFMHDIDVDEKADDKPEATPPPLPPVLPAAAAGNELKTWSLAELATMGAQPADLRAASP